MKPAPSVRIARVRCDCGAVALRFVLPGDEASGPIRGWCSAACWQRAAEGIPRNPHHSQKDRPHAR